MTATSDEDLVAQALASGDQRVYGILVQRHQSHVRNWLRQLTSNIDLADDLAQDTFIRAWDKLYSFSGEGKFLSWLMKIAYNEFLQMLRGQKRDKRLVDAYSADPSVMDIQQSSTADQGTTDLPQMLAVLSDDERVAIVLNYAYGMSHREVSEITEIPVGTVKSHIQRGKDKIRSRFNFKDTGSD